MSPHELDAVPAALLTPRTQCVHELHANLCNLLRTVLLKMWLMSLLRYYNLHVLTLTPLPPLAS
jgi:hypothetical protein